MPRLAIQEIIQLVEIAVKS